MVLLVAGTENEVVMLEAGGNEFSEEVFMEGLRRAKEVIATICQAQKELINPDKMVLAAKPEADGSGRRYPRQILRPDPRRHFHPGPRAAPPEDQGHHGRDPAGQGR